MIPPPASAPASERAVGRDGIRLWTCVSKAFFNLAAAVIIPLRFALKVLFALLILFEEWGWEQLVALVSKLARFQVWALFEGWIAGLPPYGALCVFGIPSLFLLPLKLAAVYLVAAGHVIAAALLFMGAKLAGTAYVARVFTLTKPALMQIPWFARAHDRFVPWKDTIVDWVHESALWVWARDLEQRLKESLLSVRLFLIGILPAVRLGPVRARARDVSTATGRDAPAARPAAACPASRKRTKSKGSVRKPARNSKRRRNKKRSKPR